MLCDGLVLTHPFVNGELACGNLSKRASILADLAALPPAARASDAEVTRLLDDRELWGGDFGEAERSFRKESERHSGMIPNTIGA